MQCHKSYRGGATHYPYECPVEIQTQELLSPEERSKEIENMEEEFRAKKKILITGLPLDCNEEVSQYGPMLFCVTRTCDHCHLGVPRVGVSIDI